MYRLIVESLLRPELEVGKLPFEPCFSRDWAGFKVHWRFRETVYHPPLREAEKQETASPQRWVPDQIAK
jgi:cyclic beta-1,2-glucan synthetase